MLLRGVDGPRRVRQRAAVVRLLNVAVTNSFSYDRLDRLTAVTQSGAAVTGKQATFAWNLAGQPTAIGRYADAAGTQLVAHTGYLYDDLGRLVSLVHTPAVDPAGDTIAYGFAYDAGSRLVHFLHPADGLTEYTYDNTGQLLAASQTSEIFQYDLAGNRTGAGYQVGPQNRLTADPTYDHQYDAEGNLTRRQHRATGRVDRFEYDHHNRLVRLTEYTSPAETVVAGVVEYVYDAFGRRIARREDRTSPFDLADAAIEFYHHDGHEVLFDLVDPDGTGGAAPAALARHYLYGPALDQVLAEEHTPSGTVEWLLADHQGTVRDLVDATGEVTRHIRYGAFGDVREVRDAQTGQLISTGAAAAGTRYLYTGREWDEAARLYYYRARSYDPFAGRFTSEDPLGLAAGDANYYRYVGNGPGNATDPWGLEKGPGRLTQDQQRALDLADDDATRSDLLELFALLERHPTYHWKPWPFATRDRCHTWAGETHSEILDEKLKGRFTTLSVMRWNPKYIGAIPTFWDHAVLTVTLRNGNRFYLDNALVGGSSDHIFFEVPRTLVDERSVEYREYLDRRTQMYIDCMGGPGFAPRLFE